MTRQHEQRWQARMVAVLFGILIGGKFTMPVTSPLNVLGIAALIALPLFFAVPYLQGYRERHGPEIMRAFVRQLVLLFLISAVLAWSIEMLVVRLLG